MKHEVTVLVVDSADTYVEMAPVIVSVLGGTVLHCPELACAEELILAGHRMDLIFADWELAGAGFIHMVRGSRENHLTPLVVMSSVDSDAIIAAATRAGASEHMGKPFLERALRNKIDKIERLRERRRHARHPISDCTAALHLDGDGQESLELRNLSADGCQLRAPVALGHRFHIYERGRLTFRLEGEEYVMEGRLVRVEEEPGTEERICLALRFDSAGAPQEQLQELLDRLEEQRAG